MIGAVDRVAKRLAREVASSRCGTNANFSLLLNVAAWDLLAWLCKKLPWPT